MKRVYSFLAVLIFFTIVNNAKAQEPVPAAVAPITGYLYPVIIKGKLGYIDSEGNLRINAQLERQEKYKLNDVTGPFIKAEINDKEALFKRDGTVLLDAKYSNIIVDEDAKLIRVSIGDPDNLFSMNDLTGFVDYDGKEVIPVRYQTQMFAGGYRFKEGLWCYTQNELQGYMDMTGNVVIKPQFYIAMDFSNGLAAVEKSQDGGWGYIDKTGNYKINSNLASAGDFDKDGYALVKINKNDPTLSIINNKGKFMAKNIAYRAVGGFGTGAEFSNGLVVVYDTLKNKYGYMDHNGKLAIPLQFDYAEAFDKDGRALVNLGSVTDGKGFLSSHKGGKWGFIDVHGNITTPYFRAEEASGLWEGMSTVKINGLWGFVNEKGEIAIEPQWVERPSGFDGGLARVYKESTIPSDKSYIHYMAIGYINKEGKYVWEIQE